MLRLLAPILLAASPALAEGFALRDLSGLPTDGTLAGGGDYIGRAEPQRLTLMCPTCEGGPMIDVALGRQTDGTEERLRSGQTTIADLEALCRAREESCRIEALEAGPGVGWISRYGLGGGQAGATAVVLRDGDMLTIRVIGSEPDAVGAVAARVAAAVVPRVVGD